MWTDFQRHVDYLSDASQLRLLPGVTEGLRQLREAGFLLIIVTNQSAVARGMITEAELEAIHDRLRQMLAEEGVTIDDILFCPHLPGGEMAEYARECDCRKPAPGLILAAAEKWQVLAEQSFAIGDKERDVEAGRRAGCRTVRLGEGAATTGADFVAADLAAAAELVVGESS